MIWVWIVTGVIEAYLIVRLVQAARQVTMAQVKSLFRDAWKLFKANPLLWHPFGYIAWRICRTKAERDAYIERALADGR